MPNAKKERSRKKKQASAPRRLLPPLLCAAATRLEAANAVSDLSSGLEALLSIDLPLLRDGQGTTKRAGDPPLGTAVVDPISMEIRTASTLSEVDAQKMYELLTANMHDLYVEAGWGWDEAGKRREIKHRQARLLIARCGGTSASAGGEEGPGPGATPLGKASSSAGAEAEVGSDGERIRFVKKPKGDATVTSVSTADCQAVRAEKSDVIAEQGTVEKVIERGELAGFCHFRFSWDQDEGDGGGIEDSDDVLYVHEIQVAPWAKQRGLGRRMMQVLELLANKHGMSKVMLTVFKANNQAMSFYTKKMKYDIDEDSPSNWNRPDEVYEILSKPTRHWGGR